MLTGGEVTLGASGSRIDAARLPDGTRITADVFALCAGWRTPRLLDPLGITVPLRTGDAPCLVTRAPGAALISRVIKHARAQPAAAVRRRRAAGGR